METRLSKAEVEKMVFRVMQAFPGQHSFWEELGGYNRIAIADQSIVRRNGSLLPPQYSDNGLLLVDFHTLHENKYVMPCNTLCSTPTYGLPVVDRSGQKFTIILIETEYDWFMERYSAPKKHSEPESILEEQLE